MNAPFGIKNARKWAPRVLPFPKRGMIKKQNSLKEVIWKIHQIFEGMDEERFYSLFEIRNFKL